MLKLAEEVFGPFSTVEEAVKAVDVLELEGYSNGTITIFSHGKYADDINGKTDVSVTCTETSRDRKNSFMDKISNVIFNGVDETKDIHAQLLEKGLSTEQAEQYAEHIKSGDILVTANTELKMGNDAVDDTSKMKESVNHLNK